MATNDLDQELLEKMIREYGQRQRAAEAPAAAPRQEKPREAPRSATHVHGIHWDRMPLVLTGWMLLGLWWAAGARYTLDGLPLAGNVVLNFFHVAPLFQPIADPHMYLWLAWLPAVISFVERKNRPWRTQSFSILAVYAALIWLAVVLLDAGSTWLAVMNPRPDDWRISHQLAALWPLAAAWTFLTTFLPEIGIAVLWRYLRR